MTEPNIVQFVESRLSHSHRLVSISVLVTSIVFASISIVYELRSEWVIGLGCIGFLVTILLQHLLRPDSSYVYQPLKDLTKRWREIELNLNRSIKCFRSYIGDIETINEHYRVSIQNIDGSMLVMHELLKNNMNLFNEITKSITENSTQGEVVMQDMAETTDTLAATGVQLHNISEIFNRISSETKVINEIVFKTQLLSFNAFLEAARAGKYGSGFVVVAEEIGSLASSSGGSAREIRLLLDDSLENVNEILDKTKSNINNTKTINLQAQKIFEDMVSSTTDYLKSVTDASNDQQDGIEETINLIKDLKTSSQKSRSITDQSRALLTAMDNQCTEISESIEPFVDAFDFSVSSNTSDLEDFMNGDLPNERNLESISAGNGPSGPNNDSQHRQAG